MNQKAVNVSRFLDQLQLLVNDGYKAYTISRYGKRGVVVFLEKGKSEIEINLEKEESVEIIRLRQDKGLLFVSKVRLGNEYPTVFVPVVEVWW